MTEQQAVEIATRFAKDNSLDHQGVERAFFVPVSSYESALPVMNDEWVVHFKRPMAAEREYVHVSSEADPLIVAVDTITGVASLTWLL